MKTITVDDRTFEAVRRLAAARGQTPGEWVAGEVAGADEEVGHPDGPNDPAARVAAFDQWLENFSELCHATGRPVDDPRGRFDEERAGVGLPGPDRPMREWLAAFAGLHEPVPSPVDVSRGSTGEPPRGA